MLAPKATNLVSDLGSFTQQLEQRETCCGVLVTDPTCTTTTTSLEASAPAQKLFKAFYPAGGTGRAICDSASSAIYPLFTVTRSLCALLPVRATACGAMRSAPRKVSRPRHAPTTPPRPRPSGSNHEQRLHGRGAGRRQCQRLRCQGVSGAGRRPHRPVHHHRRTGVAAGAPPHTHTHTRTPSPASRHEHVARSCHLGCPQMGVGPRARIWVASVLGSAVQGCCWCPPPPHTHARHKRTPSHLDDAVGVAVPHQVLTPQPRDAHNAHHQHAGGLGRAAAARVLHTCGPQRRGACVRLQAA